MWKEDDVNEVDEDMSDDVGNVLREEVFGSDTESVRDVPRISDDVSRAQKRRRVDGRRSRGMNDEEAESLLGAANIFFIERNHRKAIETLREVVRLKPDFPDAYSSLGLVYEDINETKKALEFYFISAYLSEQNGKTWSQLAEKFLEMENFERCLTCATKAIRIYSKDNEEELSNMYAFRGRVNRRLGRDKNAADDFCNAVRNVPNDEEYIMGFLSVVKGTTREKEAVRVFEEFMERNAPTVSMTALETLCEVLMTEDRWERTVEIIKLFDLQSLPFPIIVKLSKCFLATEKVSDAVNVLETLNRMDVSVDLYTNVAEMFMTYGYPQYAVVWWEKVQSMSENSSASLQLARCYILVSRWDESCRILEGMISHDNEAKPLLCECYVMMDRMEEARRIGDDILESYSKSLNVEDLNRVLQLSAMAVRNNKEEFISSSYREVLCRIFQEEGSGETSYDHDVLKTLSGKDVSRLALFVGVVVIDGLGFFSDVLSVLKYTTNLDLCDAEKDTIQIALALLYVHDEEWSSAWSVLHDVSVRYPSSTHLWNLLSLVVRRKGGNEVLSSRSLSSCPDTESTQMFLAGRELSNGRYAIALRKFIPVLKTMSDDPLLNLCIAVCLLHRACSNSCQTPCQHCLQAFSFLSKYSSFRDDENEVDYNLGRAFQLLRINHLAVHYYEKVLNRVNDQQRKDPGLHRDAAWNLSRMYLENGDSLLARQLIRDFITI